MKTTVSVVYNPDSQPVPWWAPGANILLAVVAYSLVLWIGLEYGLQAGVAAGLAVSLRANAVHVWAKWVRPENRQAWGK